MHVVDVATFIQPKLEVGSTSCARRVVAIAVVFAGVLVAVAVAPAAVVAVLAVFAVPALAPVPLCCA